MSRHPHLYWATYWIVINENHQILLLKRQNTWYFDGWYSLPAWHIEQGELSFDSIQHELAEEIWIEVVKDDVKLIHVLHRINNQPGWSREYFDLCYVIKTWKWDIVNNEPEMCSWIFWFDIKSLPEHMWPENRLFIDTYAENWGNEITFSEMDLRGT